MVRYIQDFKKRKITYFLKNALFVCMSAFGMILIFMYFGDYIANSAVGFVLNSKTTMPVDNFNNYTNQSFDEDFSTFIEEENIKIEEENAESSNNAIAVNLSALSGKYKTYDGTSVLNNTKYDVSGIMYDDYDKPILNKDEPCILIYHTHTSESYYGGGTVVDVGNAMAEEFERLGYKTIHLTETYDKEQFSGAYSRSIKGVEAVLRKYPTIKLVFDIHRDAITTDKGDVYCPLTTIDGKKCAQVMFVCGTDEKGLSHPEWRENFKFALDVSRTIGKTYGALSRPVNLRGDRFNTHVTKHSFLIEVGSNANTIDEATLAAIHTARAIITSVE